MFEMFRKAIRTILAATLIAVLIAAHVPLPAGTALGAAPAAPAASPGGCAPEGCCCSTAACSHGGACADGHGGDAGAGFSLVAGGCHDQTPRVTPVQLDPSVSAPESRVFHVLLPLPAPAAPDDRCLGFTGQPLVPPPRS